MRFLIKGELAFWEKKTKQNSSFKTLLWGLTAFLNCFHFLKMGGKYIKTERFNFQETVHFLKKNLFAFGVF